MNYIDIELELRKMEYDLNLINKIKEHNFVFKTSYNQSGCYSAHFFICKNCKSELFIGYRAFINDKILMYKNMLSCNEYIIKSIVE